MANKLNELKRAGLLLLDSVIMLLLLGAGYALKSALILMDQSVIAFLFGASSLFFLIPFIVDLTILFELSLIKLDSSKYRKRHKIRKSLHPSTKKIICIIVIFIIAINILFGWLSLSSRNVLLGNGEIDYYNCFNSRRKITANVDDYCSIHIRIAYLKFSIPSRYTSSSKYSLSIQIETNRQNTRAFFFLSDFRDNESFFRFLDTIKKHHCSITHSGDEYFENFIKEQSNLTADDIKQLKLWFDIQ